MKLKLAKNSLFAVLLRSPWWISMAIAAVIVLLAMALLPERYRVVGALSSLPLIVVSAMAAWRQWKLPSARHVEQILQSVRAMPWPAFAQALEVAFARDGYAVQRIKGDGADFELERQGRRMLVSAKRWKSARMGLEGLRALQAARESGEVSDALYIGMGELTDPARAYAAEQAITLWQGSELAQALRELPQQTKSRG